MSDKRPKKERKPRPPLTKDQIKELKDWLDVVEAKRQELKEKHPAFRTLDTFMEAAGLGVSTWHGWRPKEGKPHSPSIFDFRAVLRLVGMDVDVIVVPSPGAALSLGAGGGALLHNTTMSHLVKVLERLSKENQQKVLEKALEVAIRLETLEPPEPTKIAGKAADTVPQQPTAEQRAARGRRPR